MKRKHNIFVSAVVILLIISFSESSKGQFVCGDTLIDSRDGQKYPTVQIGSQCWMAASLNYGVFLNNTVGTVNQTNNSVAEKYCYNNDSNNCTLYGGLYEWDELMEYSTQPGTKGLCPAGWHIPTSEEYDTIESYFPNGNAGFELQTSGSSGFNALAGGYCYHNYTNWIYGSIGSYGTLRTSTECPDQTKAIIRYYYPSDSVLHSSTYYRKTSGYSVRCIYNGSTTSVLNLNKDPKKSQLQITPNPVKDNMTVVVKTSAASVSGYLSIYSIDGNIVAKYYVNNDSEFVIPSNERISPGLYICRFISDNGELSADERFIKL